MNFFDATLGDSFRGTHGTFTLCHDPEEEGRLIYCLHYPVNLPVRQFPVLIQYEELKDKAEKERDENKSRPKR